MFFNQVNNFEDSDEEEEYETVPQFKFVPKSTRVTNTAHSDEETDTDEEKTKKREKKKSKKLARKLASTVDVASDNEADPLSEPDPPFDTSDAKANHDAEYAEWVQRETNRLREELVQEASLALAAAKTELQRRMSDSELELLKASKAKPKEYMKFMQKYYHKGAFVPQGVAEAEELSQRSAMVAVGDDLYDKTIMPESMQVRGDDYQKKGRTKWTHLSNEDTTTPEYRKAMALMAKVQENRQNNS